MVNRLPDYVNLLYCTLLILFSFRFGSIRLLVEFKWMVHCAAIPTRSQNCRGVSVMIHEHVDEIQCCLIRRMDVPVVH